MKKVLLLACSLIMGSSMFAQSMMHDYQKELKDLGGSDMFVKQDLRREFAQSWYLPTNIASAVSINSNNFNGFVSLLFPDSTVLGITETSETDPTPRTFGHTSHSYGQIFDILDPNIQLDPTGLPVFSKHNPFTWDSVFFRYGYIRQVDSFDNGSGMQSITDTIIVRFYSFVYGAGIGVGNLNGGNTYSNVRNYSTALGYSPSNFKTEKILLTKDDTTNRTASGWTSRGVTVPVNQTIPQSSVGANNRLIGFTIHFAPGKPYNAGDTLVDLTDAQTSTWVNKNNYIVTSFVRDDNATTAQVPSDNHLTNSVILNKFSRYSASSTNWTGYVPGNAFFNNQYFTSGFHVTTQSLSVEEVSSIDKNVGDLYPNPNNTDNVNLPIRTLSNEEVTISITDIYGKVISTKTVNVTGREDINLNTSDLSSGVYNINVSINNASTTRKLMKF